ncbi:extracellular solute-binding protein [Ruminococcus sp. HUN007]|uniref:extracellular solute-binding protein n=1 Tax=Ruminococcus sp. HUN007 TaxID=1514668 RepID=UPI0005D1F171|nr:extracellular solute-binding protein [Ruminococcus sp. HUN007]
MKRRICAGIASLLAAAVIMSGCGQDLKPQSNRTDDGIRPAVSENEKKKTANGPISVYFDRKNLLDNNDLKGSVPVAVNGDSIWYYKRADIYGLHNTEKEIVSFLADTETGEVEYDEQLNIPAENYIRRDEKKVVYWLENDDNYTLNSLDLKSGKTETVDLGDTPHYTGTDGAGNIYIYSVSGDSLTVYDQSLNVSESFNIDDQLINMDVTNRFIYGMCVSHDGKVYFAVDEKDVCSSVFTIDENGKLKNLTGDIYDIREKNRIFINAEGIITLCTGYGSVICDTIDSETGEVLHRYELYGVNDLLGPSDKYDMVYLDASGVRGYDYKEDKKDLIVSEEKIPGIASVYDSGFVSGNTLFLSVLDADANKLIEVRKSTGETIITENAGGRLAAVSPDGHLYYISDEHKTKSYDDTYESVTPSFFRLNDDGTSELVFTLPEYEMEVVPSAFCISDKGEFFITYADEEDRGCVFVYDSSGNLKTKIYAPEDKYSFYKGLPRVRRNEKGDIYAVDEYNALWKIDQDKYEMNKVNCFNLLGMDNSYMDGKFGYDLLYKNLSGIYGWKEADDSVTELVLFQDAEGTVSPYDDMILFSTDEVLLPDGIMLKKADEERLAELNSRKIITLAVSGSTIKPFVDDFNTSNDDYRIVLKDYLKYGSTYDYNDFGKDSEQLSKDIVNGDIPDIIMLDNMDVSAYIPKGLFTDLKEFVEKDPELDMSDFYQNITDEFVYKDCQYTIPALNSFMTIFSVYQPEKWDYSDMISHDTINENLFEYFSSFNVYNWLLASYIDDYVDMEAKKCDFDNETFTELLDFIKSNCTFGDEIDEALWDRSYDLRSKVFSYFDEYLRSVSEDTYALGFPSKDGGRNYIQPELMFGITNSCENKEGAWEFVRLFLIDKNLKGEVNNSYTTLNGFSIRKDVDENDIKETVTDHAEYGEDISDKADEYREFVNGPVFSDLIYSGVKRIVMEEADAFFKSEDITAEETAKTIQNKVMLYLNEIA